MPKKPARRTLGRVNETHRGFEIIEFNDRYDAACSLQQSSLAEYTQPGSSAIWLGCEKNAEPHHVTGSPMAPRMHLDRNQVKALIRHLQSWIDTGSFKLTAKNGA